MLDPTMGQLGHHVVDLPPLNGSTTTRSGHTVPWDTGPRPQRRGSPVYWRAKS